MNEPLTVQEAPASYQVMLETPRIKQGYKQTEVGVIPEDWDISRLDSLGSGAIPPIKAGPFGSSLTKDIYVSHGYKVYGQEQVIRGDYLYGDYFISTAKYRELESCAINPGDVLLSLVGTMGKILVVPEGAPEGVINPRLIRFSFDRKRVCPQFFKELFESAQMQSFLARYAQGGTMGVLNASMLRPVSIALPSLLEQQAIATALSDVDALLAAQDKFIAKKRDIKQAAMQQLLTGKQRLPGFTGEWEVKRLENVATVLKGNGLSKDKVSQSGRKKCVLYGELFTTYSRVITDVFSSTDSCEGTLSINGDVLLPGSTTTVGIDLATASALLCNDVLLGGDINIVRAKSNFYSSTFLAYLLTEEKKHKIAEMAQGITIIHLYGKSLLKLEICLPTIEEQTAIATILSDMDADITALEQQRDKTHALKQGMMQELLTGKIRLVSVNT